MSKVNVNNRDLNEHKIHESDVSVYAYDKAIVEDLRARFKRKDGKEEINDTVQMGSPDQMFNIMGSLNDDQVVMPFIGLQRIDWQLNMDRQGYQTFLGTKVSYREINGQKEQVRAQVIPITINYRLSVYSTDRITNDAIIRELLFYYHLRPTLLVNVGHGLNFKHAFDIYFNSGIEDNSDIANHINNGTYFRQDLTFYTDDAYLWRADYQPLVDITTDYRFSYDSIYLDNSNNTQTKDIIDNENQEI